MITQLQPSLQTLLRERLHSSRAAIEKFCDRWQIIEVSLFGSVLRDDFKPDSDVDVLVVFAAGYSWHLFDLIDMQDELEQRFKRPVDLLQKKELINPYRRETILKSHQVIYAK
ncbi:MAG: nucleotidyltransferase family protein [Spirulinaceae cyanobacterium]